jgi:hypothetical protein
LKIGVHFNFYLGKLVPKGCLGKSKNRINNIYAVDPIFDNSQVDEIRNGCRRVIWICSNQGEIECEWKQKIDNVCILIYLAKFFKTDV